MFQIVSTVSITKLLGLDKQWFAYEFKNIDRVASFQ